VIGGVQQRVKLCTTNKKLTTDKIAINMFSRWTQENYFKYLRQEYDFDRLLQYAVESIDNEFVVVNPEYNNLSYKIKKIREKISRRMAKLYQLEEENIKENSESGNSIVGLENVENSLSAILERLKYNSEFYDSSIQACQDLTFLKENYFVGSLLTDG